MKKLEALSLPAMMGRSIVLFGLVIPASQWLLWTLTSRAPVVPTATWLRFAAMLAAAAVLWAVALHRLLRLSPGWGRSYLWGALISSFRLLQVDEFVRWPLGTLLVDWVLFSLAVGVLTGGIIHGMEVYGQRRWAE